MVVCFGILIVFGVSFLVSAQTSLDNIVVKTRILRPFYQISLFIVDKFWGGRKKVFGNRVLQKNLDTLYCGKKNEMKQFYVDKLAAALAAVFIGTGISFGAEVAGESQGILQEGNSLLRPSYGEGERQEELQYRVEGEEETERIRINVGERQYTGNEKKEYIKKAIENMDQWVLGENKSLEEVTENINLPESVLDGVVSVEWVLEPYDILDWEGRIVSDIPVEGILVKLTGYLECDGEEGEYLRYIKIMPSVRTKEEELEWKLQKELEAADSSTAEKEKLYLPKNLEDKKLEWYEAPSELGVRMCLLSFVAGVCIYFGPNKEIEKKMKYRQRQLMMDYPDLLLKLSMLLGAGLTMKGAFTKIALEYEKDKGKSIRYAYEEMLASYYEMQSGVPESVSYENFGRRCQESKYIKLGTILSQNLKKGAGGLLQILQNEAELSMEERSQMARKLGEEAGTKLLLPMILMLVVVFIILLVPAVMSF